MNYYLIDYENVKTHGLDGVSSLTQDDVVCIFYSEHADTLTFGLHRRLNETKATVIYQRVEVGLKNALDFQLSSYLGYIIHENEAKNNDVSYFIITKDQCFSSLTGYWNKRKINVTLAADISDCTVRDDTTESSNPSVNTPRCKPDELQNQVRSLISDNAIADKAAEIIRQYDSKMDVHNALVHTFPSPNHKKARELYTAIKPLIIEKNEQNNDTDLKNQVRQLINDDDAVDSVTKFILNCDSKIAVHNALQCEFPSLNHQRARELYTAIKPLIADKKGS